MQSTTIEKLLRIGQMYKVADFMPFYEFKNKLKLLPEIKLPDLIEAAGLKIYIEKPFEVADQKYIYLAVIEGPIVRKFENGHFIGYTANGTLVDCNEYTIHDDLYSPFSCVWFSRAEVDEFIAQNPQFVTLEAESVKPEKLGKRQWRADYPLLAAVVDMVECGKSREDIARALKNKGISMKLIGLLLKPTMDIVKEDSLRRQAQRLIEKE